MGRRGLGTVEEGKMWPVCNVKEKEKNKNVGKKKVTTDHLSSPPPHHHIAPKINKSEEKKTTRDFLIRFHFTVYSCQRRSEVPMVSL